MWYQRKSFHSNHSCLILRICVWVYGVMDTMFPPLLISSISDFSIVGKSILNGTKFFPPSLVLEPLCSFIYGTSLSWLMCLPPLYIFLQLLCSLFVIISPLLYWSHAVPNCLPAVLETLTLHCFCCLLEWNDDRPVRQLCCTVYLYACNMCSKQFTIWWIIIDPHFIALNLFFP